MREKGGAKKRCKGREGKGGENLPFSPLSSKVVFFTFSNICICYLSLTHTYWSVTKNRRINLDKACQINPVNSIGYSIGDLSLAELKSLVPVVKCFNKDTLTDEVAGGEMSKSSAFVSPINASDRSGSHMMSVMWPHIHSRLRSYLQSLSLSPQRALGLSNHRV